MTALDENAKRKAVANERAKLTATFLNGVAIAMIAVGGIAPIAAFSIQDTVFTARAPVAILMAFATGVALHLLARRLLGSLTP